MKSLKIIIAAMLLLCLAPMPYGYYMLVRWAAMVVFTVTAFNYYAENKKELAVTFGALALLFQPFIKIALGRTIWNIVDVIVAILLIVLLFTENKKE
jgi:predicted membrane protein